MNLSATRRDFRRGKNGIISSEKLAKLVRSPIWYTRFPKVSRAQKAGIIAYGLLRRQTPKQSLKQAHHTLYRDMMSLLAVDRVNLGTSEDGLYVFDRERAPIDRFVIHHSGRAGGLDLNELSAISLIRVYVPAYQSPSKDDAPRLRGKPIYSGHFRGSRQVFFPYHWIIRQDGSFERLLEDDQIGWHCGSWSMNKRSIAICFDGDYSHSSPNRLMLASARRIMREHYGALIVPSPHTVLGAQEVINDTVSPGDQFLSGDAWKNALLVKGWD